MNIIIFHRPSDASLSNFLFLSHTDTHLDLSFIVLATVSYGVLFFSIGTAFLPGHAAWCTLLMWMCSLIGALIANQIFLPRVIGMLVAGILLQNIPWSAIDAFPPKWGTQMRAAALATIFLRCGLELDFGTMRRYKNPALRLALIPGLIEALYDAGLGVALFNMDYTLALCMGFILKAVGPGLVVPAMFRLQRAKIGTDKGIPATVVISASFDDIIAITGYAIFSTIAIRPEPGSSDSGGNVVWSIASGPLQVVFGILGGLLAGTAVGATLLWDSHMKRFCALFGAGMLLMFFLEYWGLLSGGALGALFTGLVASNLWEKGLPRRLSSGPSYLYSPECERWMSVVWRWVMEPILFVTVGSTLDFAKLSGGTIPKAVCIVLTGVTLRMICTVVAMSGFAYTRREKIFYALAWTPKATVQAALSAAPLTLIQKYKVGSPDYAEWVAWGNDILTTGLFAIILCGTLGVLAIHFFAPILLEPAAETHSDDGDGDECDDEIESNDEIGVDGDSSGDGRAATTTTTTGGGGGGVNDGSGDWQHQQHHRHPSLPALKQPLERSRSAASYGTSITAVGGGGGGGGGKRASSDTGSRPSSPMPQTTAISQLIAGEDLALVADYITSIQLLTSAVVAGETVYSRDDVVRMSDRVLDMQHRIESEVGQREPSVRELFRTASVLTARRPFGWNNRSGAGSRGTVRAESAPYHSRQKSVSGAVGQPPAGGGGGDDSLV